MSIQETMCDCNTTLPFVHWDGCGTNRLVDTEVPIASPDKSISKTMYEALKRSQWDGYVTAGGYEYQPYHGCFLCQRHEDDGHAGTCIVGNAIKAYEGGQ